MRELVLIIPTYPTPQILKTLIRLKEGVFFLSKAYPTKRPSNAEVGLLKCFSNYKNVFNKFLFRDRKPQNKK